MAKLLLSTALNSLGENAVNVRNKFIAGRKHFVSPKDHPMSSKFLELLCQPNLQDSMPNSQFCELIDITINDSIQDEHWLTRYCDMLIASFDGVKLKSKLDERADKYHKYLTGTLIPDFKKKTHDSKCSDDEIWLCLTDIYKITAALYAAFSGHRFTLNVTRRSLDNLEETLRENLLPAFLGINPYKREERQYAVFLSWILTEKICKQDGIIAEEQSHDTK